MTLQRSLGCLRTAAKRLQTMERPNNRRLSYGDGQAHEKILTRTLVGSAWMLATR